MELVRIGEAAKMTGLHQQTLRRLAADGEVPVSWSPASKELRRDHEIRTATFAPVHKTSRKFGPTPEQHHLATAKRRPTTQSRSIVKPRISAVPRSGKGRLGRVCSPVGQGTHHSSLQSLALDRRIDTYSYAKT